MNRSKKATLSLVLIGNALILVVIAGGIWLSGPGTGAPDPIPATVNFDQDETIRGSELTSCKYEVGSPKFRNCLVDHGFHIFEQRTYVVAIHTEGYFPRKNVSWFMTWNAPQMKPNEILIHSSYYSEAS